MSDDRGQSYTSGNEEFSRVGDGLGLSGGIFAGQSGDLLVLFIVSAGTAIE
jgi:hypothetical protein